MNENLFLKLEPVKSIRRREFLKGLGIGFATSLVAFSTWLLSTNRKDEEKANNPKKIENTIEIKVEKEMAKEEKPKGIIEIVKQELDLKPEIRKRDVWYLQIAAYRNKDSAEKLLEKLNNIKYNGKFEEKNGLYRVLIRTFSKELAHWLKNDINPRYGNALIVSRKEKCEHYSREQLEKIVDYFAEKNSKIFAELDIDAKKLFRAIVKRESDFDPEKVAHKIDESISYQFVYDAKKKRTIKKRIVNYSHKRDGNGNKEVTAIGLMQIALKNRYLFPFYLDEYFHPIKNTYMGTILLVDAANYIENVIGAKSNEFENVKTIAFIYNAGAENFRRWNAIPKKHQTKEFMENVLATYKSI